MTTASLSELEIVTRLLEIHAARRTFDVEEAELLALLKKQKRGATPPVKLTFGKNIITWDGGFLYIKGKGYKFVKALYDTNSMKMKESVLGERVWGYEQSHKNFKDMFYEIQEKLEKAKFPYQLLPVMSKDKTVPTGEKYPDGRPKLKHLRPVIIGVKLTTGKNSAIPAVDF